MSAEKWRENCRPGDFWFYGEIAKVANMARDFCPWAEQEREVHQLEVQCHQNWMQHRPPCIAACVTSRCLMHNITIYTFRPRPLENKVQFLDLIHTYGIYPLMLPFLQHRINIFIQLCLRKYFVCNSDLCSFALSLFSVAMCQFDWFLMETESEYLSCLYNRCITNIAPPHVFIRNKEASEQIKEITWPSLLSPLLTSGWVMSDSLSKKEEGGEEGLGWFERELGRVGAVFRKLFAIIKLRSSQRGAIKNEKTVKEQRRNNHRTTKEQSWNKEETTKKQQKYKKGTT